MPNQITYMLIIYALLHTSATAQATRVNINNHHVVVQTVIASQHPLSTWQDIVSQHHDPGAVEQAANAVLSRLQDMPSQDIFKPLLQHWQKHQPIATRASDDHGHEVGVYLIAARATGELNRLLSDQTERYIYALADHRPEALLSEMSDLYQQFHPAITRGIKTAIVHLNQQQQALIIRQQLAQQAQISAISPMLAVTLNSPDIQQMIVMSKQSSAIGSLLNAWQQNPPNNRQWLKAIAQQPGPHQIQAVGLFNRVDLTQQDTQWLTGLLKNQKLGRTAARVLGQQNNDKLMDDLFERWQQSGSETLNTNLLYALSRNSTGLSKLKTAMQQKSLKLSNNQKQWLQKQLGATHEK